VEEALGLRFEHRDTETDASVVDRVWRTCSEAEGTMTSAARTCCQLILTRMQGQVLVSGRRRRQAQIAIAHMMARTAGTDQWKPLT
jgi:hypothetical protein